MLAFSLPAQAKGIPLYFGESEDLNMIERVEPLVIEDETFFLGYHTYFKWFLAGVYVRDRGYVLIDASKTRYIELDEKDIQQLQEEEMLPTPLPEYKLEGIDYLKGYSLWLILLALAIYGGFKMRPKKTPVAATEEVATAASQTETEPELKL